MKCNSNCPLICVMMFCLASSGCSTLLPPGARSAENEVSERCRSIDRRFRVYGALARLGGVGAVSSGIGSAATDDTPRLAFGASALTFGLLAATAGFLHSRAAVDYVQTCTVNEGKPPGPDGLGF